MPTLLPIFADHLSHDLASLRDADKSDSIVLMMEVGEEADVIWHHRKKMAFLFSAMRHFAAELSERSWKLRYVKLDDPDNRGGFDGEIRRAVEDLRIDRICLTEPGEWRVREMARGWEKSHGIPVDILEDHRFVASHSEFSEWASGRKQWRMEFFYREMRRKTGLLMNGDQPEGERWNFDSENREPAIGGLEFPSPTAFEPDEITREVIDMVQELYPDRIGDIEPFRMAVTSKHASKAARNFMKEALPDFGTYQDAMVVGEPFLFHSMLSAYLNAGLLDPVELCRMAVAEYEAGRAPLNSVEGYVRQIIGWREYVRGIYWEKMPQYLEMNALGADRDLPEFYWTGDTRMRCVAEAVAQTKTHAHSHHIQRLMITGTFALLAGVDPKQVHEWYLAVYADAFEWVELPNTLGMSQYGDGGLMASKPYAASGAYINRMSDYCGKCHYDVKQRTGEDACPFNSMYWAFLDKNRDRLSENRRMAMPYRNLDRMKAEARKEILDQASDVLERMKNNEL